MDLLPYFKEMGIAGSVIFGCLYIRSEIMRNKLVDMLIDLVPKSTLAIERSNEISRAANQTLEKMMDLIRDGKRQSGKD